MLPGPPRRRRARPVADASLDALAERGEDLAKGWLLALVEQAPLEQAPRILAADLTREGPRICAAVLRALSSDAEERRLGPDGALADLTARIGALAGAAGPRGAALAVDALQGVMWAALRAELRDPDPDLVSQLAERLAQVCALLREAALGGEAGSASARAESARVVPEPAPVAAAPVDAPASAAAPAEPAPVAAAPAPVAIEPASAPAPVAPEPQLRAWMGAGPAPTSAAPLWVGALAEEIGRTSGASLSLLLAELEDADRVLAVEAEPELVFNDFTQALRRAVRRQDMLVSETPSRAWVIARDTNRLSGRALARRIVTTVAEGEPWRGAPLQASVGLAVLGEDGATAAELIEAAEEARYAAAAAGGGF